MFYVVQSMGRNSRDRNDNIFIQRCISYTAMFRFIVGL